MISLRLLYAIVETEPGTFRNAQLSAIEATFNYLNTDMDLESNHDISVLADVFQKQGIVLILHVTRAENGKWYASFETHQQYPDPEANICGFLNQIEGLNSDARTVWRTCVKREFNIGYECGKKPWAFNTALSSPTLKRIADAALRITLYPSTES